MNYSSDNVISAAASNQPWNRDKCQCANWDSLVPQQVWLNGQCIGKLMPRSLLKNLGYGIAAHSKPAIDTRFEQ